MLTKINVSLLEIRRTFDESVRPDFVQAPDSIYNESINQSIPNFKWSSLSNKTLLDPLDTGFIKYSLRNIQEKDFVNR